MYLRQDIEVLSVPARLRDLELTEAELVQEALKF